MQDLVVALDNADSRMWYAHFFPQEGTAPTFVAPEWVLRNYGRSPSFTLTAGSDFCHSERPTRGACLPATMPQAGPLHAMPLAACALLREGAVLSRRKRIVYSSF